MAEFYNSVACKRCGSSRSSDLNVPCPMCGSRKTPLIGYTYSGERSQIITILVIIFICLILAVASGAIYVFLKTMEIQFN